MTKMFRPILLLCACYIVGSSTALAEITPITREIAAKVLAMAEDARQAHPTAPQDAASAFQAAFSRAFGDIEPVDLRVITPPNIVMVLSTPIIKLRSVFVETLTQSQQMPSIETLTSLRTVTLSITPKQRDAPDISQVVLLRADQEVPSITSALSPMTFTNAVGDVISVHAGTVDFPMSAFAPGASLALLCINRDDPIRWNLNAADVARIR